MIYLYMVTTSNRMAKTFTLIGSMEHCKLLEDKIADKLVSDFFSISKLYPVDFDPNSQSPHVFSVNYL